MQLRFCLFFRQIDFETYSELCTEENQGKWHTFSNDNKKEHLFNTAAPISNALLSEMVRQAGFEPTTLWFVARYSIQLSYWRTEKKNSAVLIDSVQVLFLRIPLMRDAVCNRETDVFNSGFTTLVFVCRTPFSIHEQLQ